MSTAQQSRCDAQALRTDKARRSLESAVTACLTASGAFSWFRGGIKRSLRVFMDNLAAFARQCLTEDLVAAVGSLYAKLRGRLRDRLRDLSLCRQRLLHMQELLRVEDVADIPSLDSGESQMLFTGSQTSLHDSWQGPADAGTVRIVLPDGSTTLEDGAAQVLEGLTRDQWIQLDQSLQENVLGLVGGLYQVCTSVGDLKRYLASPMITQSIHYLESQLPKTDVAQVEFSLDIAGEGEVRERILTYYKQALPLTRGVEILVHAATEEIGDQGEEVLASPEADSLPTGEDAARESCFLLAPSSEAGKLYGEQAEQALPHLQVVPAPNQTDMLFCREQNFLSPEELSQLLQGCHKAYEATATIPQHSPHARFDFQDWIPLEP
jgi:hypothetical protein